MAANEKNSISTENLSKPNLARQLTGTSFLTLEHVGYFALVVLLPSVLLVGVATALGLWGHSKEEPILMIYPPAQSYDTVTAIFVAATLLVLTPLLYCLQRRVAAEYKKRVGYTGRVAYKLPVYTALGLLSAMAIGAFTVMLHVFLNSLVNIGVSGAHIGQMYVGQFLPALLGLVVYGMAAWYVLWFAKGKAMSRTFVRIISLLSAVMVVALFVTALSVNHDTKKSNDNGPIQIQPYPSQNGTYNF